MFSTGMFKWMFGMFMWLWLALTPLGFAEGSGGDPSTGSPKTGQAGQGGDGDGDPSTSSGQDDDDGDPSTGSGQGDDDDDDTDDPKELKKRLERERKKREKLEKKEADRKKKEADAKKKKLQDDGKWKELAELREQEKKDLEEARHKDRRNHSIDLALQRAGIKKDEYMRLFDYDAIELDDDGNFDGDDVKTTVDEFKEKNPELFGAAGAADENAPEDGNHQKPKDKQKGTAKSAAKNYAAQLNKQGERKSKFFTRQG